MSYSLTRHLRLRPAPRPGRFLAENLYRDTRLEAGLEQWSVLAEYESSRPLGGSALEKEAAEKGILVPEGPSEPSRWVSRFELAAHPLLDGGALSSLKEICRPTTTFEQCHFLWADPTRLFGVAVDHARAFLDLDVGAPESGLADAELARLSLGIPERKESFEQQSCTLATTLARLELIRANHPPPARVLVLGDDDLINFAFARYPEYELDVFEYDLELVKFFQAHSTARIHRRDLTKGLPEEHHGLYDAVITDPMYEADGMEWFIRCCAQGLKGEEARLYISTCPALLEDSDRFFAGLEENGLEVRQRRADFNRYPFPRDVARDTLAGLLELGYDRRLCRALMKVPYLYADMFICALRRS